MQVLDHRGTVHGTVAGVEAERIAVTRRGMDGPETHWMPAAAIEWVDHAVHLLQGAGEVGTGTGAAGMPDARRAGPGRRLLLAGLFGLVVVAAAVVLMLQGGRGVSPQAASGAPAGRTVAPAPGSLSDDIQRFLASPDPAPRSFTLDAFDFAAGQATVPAPAAKELATLAQILRTHPAAQIRIVGYSDLPGNAGAAADVDAAIALGRARAGAIAAVLVAQGVAPRAVTTISGDDPAFLDGLSRPDAKGVDRHPDLVVTRK